MSTNSSRPIKGNSLELNDLSDKSLLRMRAAVDVELGRRNLEFSVGSIGEELVVDFFNSTPGLPTLIAAPRGAKNVDALSREGDRYSIKTVMKAKKTGTIYPDQTDKGKRLFEYLLIVQLDSDYSLKSVCRFSWSIFLEARSWDKRMSAWYVPVSKVKLSLGETLLSRDG